MQWVSNSVDATALLALTAARHHGVTRLEQSRWRLGDRSWIHGFNHDDKELGLWHGMGCHHLAVKVEEVHQARHQNVLKHGVLIVPQGNGQAYRHIHAEQPRTGKGESVG